MNLWNLLRHISLRHLRLRRAQTLMAAVGICLGVAAIVSIGVVNKSVLFSFEDSFTRVTGRAKLQVTGAQSGFPESLIDRVRNVAGVEYAVPAIETDAMLVAGRERSLMILGVDVLVDTQVRDYSLTNESADVPDPMLFLARPDSILVTRAMAEREGYRLDQKIQVQTVEGIRTFRIRGILNPEGPAKAMGGNLAIMDIYAAQLAFGKRGRIDRIDVSLRPGEELEKVRRAIVEALPRGYTVDTPAGRTRQVEAMIAKFQNGFNLISYLAIFVGMYLIYNAVSISVVHRRRETGILRALGCTRRDIVALFLGETLVVSVLASLLGVGLGLALADALVGTFGRVVSETYARTSITGIHVTWFYPALGFSCGVAASLVAALFPARSGSRVPPASAIRSIPYAGEGFFTAGRLNRGGAACLALSFSLLAAYSRAGDAFPVKGTALLFLSQLLMAIGVSLFTPSFLSRFVILFNRLFSSRFGAAGRLAGLNLRKNLTRNAVAVAAVFFGIAIFVSSSGFVYSVKESAISWLDSIIRADIIVSSGHPSSSPNPRTIPMPMDLGRKLERVPGVLSADPWRRTIIDYRGRSVLLSVIDIARRSEYSSYVVSRGNARDLVHVMPNRDNVVVSEPFAAIFRVKPGDTLELPTPSGTVRFNVAAVVVDYLCDHGAIGMDLHTYQRHWGDRLVDLFSVRVRPGAKVSEVRDAIQKSLGNDRRLFVLPALEFKNEIRKVLDGMFIFNYALNIITLTIACLGIIVTLFASVTERTREIGALRSIGMLRRQIYGVVVLESVLMGLAGGSLGSAAGVLLGWASLEGFFVANYGSAARYHLPVDAICWALLLAAALSALAGLVPGRQAAKTNIVEALSYE